MDRFVAQFATEDGDLILCPAHGVGYQRDRKHIISYGVEYFDKYLGYEGSEIAQKINRGRIDLVAKHFDPIKAVLDIGIGSGEFIKHRPNTFGRDVNPIAVAWLKENSLWACSLADFGAFTFWDVLEHIDTPDEYFQHISPGAFLFTSIPIFGDLTRIRQSRHYRPGEHLYYWTQQGFIEWMGLHGFEFLEHQTFEMDAGREDIHSFAFRRCLLKP